MKYEMTVRMWKHPIYSNLQECMSWHAFACVCCWKDVVAAACKRKAPNSQTRPKSQSAAMAIGLTARVIETVKLIAQGPPQSRKGGEWQGFGSLKMST